MQHIFCCLIPGFEKATIGPSDLSQVEGRSCEKMSQKEDKHPSKFFAVRVESSCWHFQVPDWPSETRWCCPMHPSCPRVDSGPDVRLPWGGDMTVCVTAPLLVPSSSHEPQRHSVPLGCALLKLSVALEYPTENFGFYGFATKITFGHGSQPEAGYCFVSLTYTDLGPRAQLPLAFTFPLPFWVRGWQEEGGLR